MSGATAGYSGGGATAYPAEESGKDLGGEHLSDLTGSKAGTDGATPGSAGYDGGGATAFPAEQSGKDLGGEHLSDLSSSDNKGDLPDLGKAPGAELGIAPETTDSA